MPTWTTSAAVTSYLTSIAMVVLGILTQLHVTVPAGVSGGVSTWAGIVGYIVAAGAQIANVLSHRAAAAKVLVADIASDHLYRSNT